MKKIISICCVNLIMILAVSACGSSSGDLDTFDNADSADSLNPKYTGNRDPALLKPGNTVNFTRTLLGFEELFLFKNSSAKFKKSNEFSRSWGMLDFSGLLSRIAISHPQSEVYRQRSEATGCLHSGELEVEDNSIDASVSAIKVFSFKNCQHDVGGVVLNGSVYVTQEYDSFGLNSTSEKKTVEFTDMIISVHGERYSYTGNQIFNKIYTGSSSDSPTVLSLTASMNIIERDLNDNTFNLLDNVEIAYSHNDADKISGRLYVHDRGYVSLLGTDDLDLSVFLNLITDSWHVLVSPAPREGSILLKGASHSQAKIEFLRSSRDVETSQVTKQYLINLDQDGDGIFEVRAIQSDQDIQNNEPGAFVEQYLPLAQISWVGDEGFILGDTIKLSGAMSSDPDSSPFMPLEYFWTLEAKPESSRTVLSRVIGEETSFSPDVYGEFQVSLKVTDLDGNTALKVKNFDFSDKPPQVEFKPNEIENGRLELGTVLWLPVRVSDAEDLPGIQQDYNFEWGLHRPENSLSVLQSSGRLNALLIPDQPGDYAVSYTTSDSQGQTTTETLSFSVIGSPPVAIINNDHDHLEIFVGKPRALHSDNGYSGGDFDLSYNWEFVDKPAGSNARLDNANSRFNVMFNPDLVGLYRIRLTVTDSYGVSDSVEKEYDVVAE